MPTLKSVTSSRQSRVFPIPLPQGSLWIGDMMTQSGRVYPAPRDQCEVHVWFDHAVPALLFIAKANETPWAFAGLKHSLAGSVVVDGGLTGIGPSHPALEQERVEDAIGIECGMFESTLVCRSGFGDGVYSIFSATREGENVGLWIDFGVIDIQEAQKVLHPKKDPKELRLLFDQFESAAKHKTPFPELDALLSSRKSKAYVPFFPRVIELLEAEAVSETVTHLANRWSVYFPAFQDLLCSTLSVEALERTAGNLMATSQRGSTSFVSRTDGLFDDVVFDQSVQIQIAQSKRFGKAFRFRFGSASLLWDEAAQLKDACDVAFFSRPDVAGVAVHRADVDLVIQALHQRDEVLAVQNLRRFLRPRLP